MTADELLASIGQQADLGNVALDASGVCRLVFDGVTEVDLEQSPDAASLHLHAALGPASPHAEPEFYRMLLAGNLYGRQTAGNVLALLPVDGAVFLCRTVPLERVDADAFADVLAEFVRQARQWSARIQSGPDGDVVPLPDAPVDLRNMMRV
jgi:hypothetical protein